MLKIQARSVDDSLAGDFLTPVGLTTDRLRPLPLRLKLQQAGERLGSSICYGIVTEHGGSISCRRKSPRRGSCVSHCIFPNGQCWLELEQFYEETTTRQDEKDTLCLARAIEPNLFKVGGKKIISCWYISKRAWSEGDTGCTALRVRGENRHKRAFQEDAMALIVNAHGALVFRKQASTALRMKVRRDER